MSNPESTDPSMSRQTWVDAALGALADNGIDALKVESLARTLAVTKGSFYHHFSDRRDLLTAVLDRWEELATDRIIDQVETLRSDDPVKRLRALGQAVFSADPIGGRVETAIRAWAAADEIAVRAVERVDARRLDYVVGLLRPIGHSPASARRRARLLYRVMIGDFLWRNSGGPAISNADLDDLADLLASPKDR